MYYTLLLFPAAYLIGSINFSIILFKLLGKTDPRESHSGNAGTTNVYRQSGIIWATVVLLLDMGRAVAVCVIAVRILDWNFVTWTGFFLILGNRFPCFHRFRGGKGVANYLGFSIYLSPISTAISCLAWLLTYRLTKKPFIGSFAMVSVLGTGTILLAPNAIFAVAGTVSTCAFVVVNHYSNIRDQTRNQGLVENSNG